MATVQAPRLNVRVLVETHQVGLWRYLRYLGCDPATADDLCQETFLAVLRAPFADYDPAATARYLRTVARNLMRKHARREARAPAREDLDRLEDVWEQRAAADGGEAYVEAVRACLSRLDDAQRRALELRYAGERSRAQMGQELALSEDGVKSLLRRARAALRVCVERRMS
jgi:RNA polymerase sigma-70 factor (ECF subfamily)